MSKVTCSPLSSHETDSQMSLLSRELDPQNRMLKTRRNALTPISHLPTEILSRIFITIAYSCFDGSRGNDLSWIRSVTAVCSHWRAIALECPGLWCFIGFKHPIWTEEMLKRSKEAPLIVRFNDPFITIRRMENVHLALQHISRIMELQLVTTKANIEKVMDRTDKCAPLLRSLHLSNPLYNRSAFNEYTLPATLFVDDGHRLERLELTNCIISWDSPLLCGLVHLKLHKIYNGPRPTMMKVLDALEQMPLLETLDLAGWLPTADDRSSSRRVHLPHMTSLRLSSSLAVECAYFLDHITYPASTSLGLRCNLSTKDDILLLSDGISSVWNGVDGSKLLRSLSVYSVSAKSTTLRGWITEGRTDARYLSEPAQIEINLQWNQISDHEAGNVIFDFCKTLTLTDLRSLFVSAYYPVPEATWLRAFGHLASLRTVHVRGYPAFGLVSALSTVLEMLEGNLAEEGDPKGNIFLSSLRNLWLKVYAVNNTKFFEDLQDCLMTRCHWNAEVQFLYLDCAEEFYHQVELLREIVVDVDRHEVSSGEDVSESESSS